MAQFSKSHWQGDHTGRCIANASIVCTLINQSFYQAEKQTFQQFDLKKTTYSPCGWLGLFTLLLERDLEPKLSFIRCATKMQNTVNYHQGCEKVPTKSAGCTIQLHWNRIYPNILSQNASKIVVSQWIFKILSLVIFTEFSVRSFSTLYALLKAHYYNINTSKY